jgi:hypothetical protein
VRGCGDVALVVREHLLDYAQIVQPASETLTLREVRHGDVVAAPRCTQPPHHVRHPGEPEPDLGVGEWSTSPSTPLSGMNRSSKNTSQRPPIIARSTVSM